MKKAHRPSQHISGKYSALIVFSMFMLFFITFNCRTWAQEIFEKEYLLGPYDKLTIYVWRHPEVSTGGTLQAGALGNYLEVSVDGYISYPFLGQICVTGMTTQELRLKIIESLIDIYIDPVVVVSVFQKKPFRLYVLGEVKNPGMYEMQKTELTLQEAIALAGGTTTRAAVSRVTLQRGKELIHLNLENSLYRGGEGPDVKVKPEDILIIPEQRSRVAVIGEVKNPNVYDIRDGNTLLDGITMAGGFNNRAKPRNVAIYRRTNGKDEIIKVDTREIFDKSKVGKNVILQDRDIVFIPQINAPSMDDLTKLAVFGYYINLFFPK